MTGAPLLLIPTLPLSPSAIAVVGVVSEKDWALGARFLLSARHLSSFTPTMPTIKRSSRHRLHRPDPTPQSYGVRSPQRNASAFHPPKLLANTRVWQGLWALAIMLVSLLVYKGSSYIQTICRRTP